MIPLLLLTAIALCCLIVYLALAEPRRERADSNPDAIKAERTYFDTIGETS